MGRSRSFPVLVQPGLHQTFLKTVKTNKKKYIVLGTINNVGVIKISNVRYVGYL